MCGIAGIYNLSKQAVEISSLKLMTDTLIHRGPDAQGYWISDKGNIGFGHRRLAIIDLTEAGGQPMHYGDGRFTVTYNGEIYNYLELKSNLIKKGYKFFSHSDTEVLLALFAEKKEQCLDELDGMFSFAIWDEKTQELFCARDRFGEKPFYYYIDQNRFVFASEIKSLFAYGIEKKVANRKLFDYLVYGATESPYRRDATFYEQVFQLEPAHFLKISQTGLRKTQYWDIDLNNKNEDISFSSAVEKFTELFDLSVKRRLRSDVKVGSSLSGGLDSSSIAATVAKFIPHKEYQQTFSARFKNSSLDEGRHIDSVTKHLQIKSNRAWVNENDLSSQLDKIFYYHEEPFVSSSIIAQWKVMKLAGEQDVTVLLDGQGSDEYLAGYLSYRDIFFYELLLKDKKKFETELKSYENLYNLRYDKKKLLGFCCPGLKHKVGTAKRKYMFKLNLDDKYSGINRNFAREFGSHISPYFPEFNKLDRHLRFSTTITGLGELLKYADRNSMAHSRETRTPFLFHKLVEFGFTLPGNYKIHNGWLKYLLRAAMKARLPADIVWRKDKIGYRPPQDKWLQTPVIQEKINHSIDVLKQNKIIKKPLASCYWQYLMAAKLFAK